LEINGIGNKKHIPKPYKWKNRAIPKGAKKGIFYHLGPGRPPLHHGNFLDLFWEKEQMFIKKFWKFFRLFLGKRMNII